MPCMHCDGLDGYKRMKMKKIKVFKLNCSFFTALHNDSVVKKLVIYIGYQIVGSQV